MKPYTTGGHSAYQDLVLTQLRKYYPDAADSLPSSTWEIMERFWNLDLSPLNSIMQDCYSVFGPAPRQPSDMLRSFLLSLEFKIPSITQWSSELRHNHLYAILSGFPVGNTPGVGTFYDFFHRLWKSDKPDIRDPVHPPKKSPKKPDKKGGKRLHRQTKSGLKIFWHSFRKLPLMKQIPVLCSLRSSANCFCAPLRRKAWLT